MGVRGLKTFFEQKQFIKTISIDTEIAKWKRRHPNVTPIIVFDIAGLSFNNETFICGGSSRDDDDVLEKWFIRFKKLDVKLVFFQDLNLEKKKELSFMRRKNCEFKSQLELFKKLDAGTMTADLQRRDKYSKDSYTTPNLISIASKYGDFKFGRWHHDCDLDIARYAWKNNAMAIFSVDTDFIIFDGFWQLWSFGHDFEKFEAIEFDRYSLCREMNLTVKQLPLFATLMINDDTEKYWDELRTFHRRLHWNCNKFKRVAIYILKNVREWPLSERNIDAIIRDVFPKGGFDKIEMRKLIRDSINSYDIYSDNADRPIDDPILEELLNRQGCLMVLRHYVNFNIKATQRMKMPIMNTEKHSIELNDCLIQILRKQVGILNIHKKKEKNAIQKFKLIAKTSYGNDYHIFHVRPIYPHDSMLDTYIVDILTAGEHCADKLFEDRWILLAWMLSISEKHRDALKSMNNELKIACATLLVLVQKHILIKKAADGILIVEMAVRQNKVPKCVVPDYLNSSNVQVSHTYRKVYSKVSETFEIAGLFTSHLYRFDGVYFQHVMTNDELFDKNKGSIDLYRIYDD